MHENLNLLYPFIFLFGLSLGSFINVVIHRLPIILQRQWQDELSAWQSESMLFADNSLQANTSAQPQLNQKHVQQTEPEALPESYNVAWPGSHCPHCLHKIAPYDNIPLISFLLLKGRCRHCKTTISLRYPLIELLAGSLALVSTVQFGFTLEAIVYFSVSLCLLALLTIDLNTQLLPDTLTIPLLWAGLLFHSVTNKSQLDLYLWGAVAGYLVLWSVYWLFKLLTGKEGMGYGDFKLLAAIGAWAGWIALPPIMLISALSGLVMALLLRLTKKSPPGSAIPFGPALAIAGWLVLYFPDTIQRLMQSLFI